MPRAPQPVRSVGIAFTAIAVAVALAVGAAHAEPPPPATPNQLFAHQLYPDLFGRPATANEINDLADALDAGQITRDEAGVGSAASYAYAQQLVEGFYQNTLGRSPELEGLSYWTNEIFDGRRTAAQVGAAIYASDEWYTAVGGTDQLWVAALYERLLHRAPDPEGQLYWMQRTVTDGRDVVAIVFYQSDESLRARTSALYTKLLGRVPDAAGLDYWSSQMLERGDRVVAGLLAGSQEYFDRAQQPSLS